MNDHDSACLWTQMAGNKVTPPPVADCPYCPMLREARADEQDRIVAEVEALPVYLVDDQSEPGGPSIIHRTVSLESVLSIAQGGTDGEGA